MTIPSVADLPDEDLQALIVAIEEEIRARAAQRAQDQQDASVSVQQAIAALDALIGPDTPTTPGVDTLTEVRLFSQEEMQTHAGLGLALAFHALELLARTTRNLALIVSRGQR